MQTGGFQKKSRWGEDKSETYHARFCSANKRVASKVDEAYQVYVSPCSGMILCSCFDRCLAGFSLKFGKFGQRNGNFNLELSNFSTSEQTNNTFTGTRRIARSFIPRFGANAQPRDMRGKNTVLRGSAAYSLRQQCLNNENKPEHMKS